MILPGQTERMRRSLHAFAREAWPLVDPSPFVDNWHLEVLAARLSALFNGVLTRDTINVPPGTSKSLFSGVFGPAWWWIDHPEEMFMNVSYTPRLPTRDAEKLIKLVSSPWYVERWGERIAKPSSVKASEFNTIQGGGRFSTSVHGPGTGWHCDIQLFDDPIKPDDAVSITGAELDNTYRIMGDTFGSRHRDEATFRRGIIMQRLQDGDPSDRAVLDGWTNLRLPMLFEVEDADPEDRRTYEGEPLFPARHPIESLEKKRRDMTEAAWATQYQQRPSAVGGALIREEWIEDAAVSADELRGVDGRDAQSWDLTFKGDETSDFVAGQFWRAAWINGETHYFLLAEPVFERLTFEESLVEIEKKHELWPCGECFIENKANGPGIESMLRRKFPGWVKLVEPLGGKVARAHRTAPLWRAGRVHLLRGPWYDRMKRTFSRFPKVRHDDEVDAMTQAVNALSRSDPMHEKMRAIRGRLG